MSDDQKLLRVTPRMITAGTDAKTGAPALRLTIRREDGEALDYHLLLTPEAARRAGAALVLASDLDAAARLLTQGQPAVISAELATLQEGEAVLSERGGPAIGLLGAEKVVGSHQVRQREERRTLVQRLEDAAQALLDRVKAGAGSPMEELFKLEDALFALRHSKEKQRADLPLNVRA
jgi:hypothetical protein